MNLRNARVLFAGLAFLLAPTVVAFVLALDVPPLRGRVNDYAGMLPADRARALEDRLARFEAETGHQIAVLTLPTLQGDSLEDFSIRVAESWKIGKKGFDNGRARSRPPSPRPNQDDQRKRNPQDHRYDPH